MKTITNGCLNKQSPRQKKCSKNGAHTGAFGGNMAVAMAMNPFKTRVNASFSLSLGVPRCMVRVIVVVPSVDEIKMQKINR